MKSYQVYILRCSDGTFYTGVTSRLEQRLAEHQSGKDPSSYTFKRRPLELVLVETFGRIEDAISAEKRVKKWSQAKKRKLISGDWSL